MRRNWKLKSSIDEGERKRCVIKFNHKENVGCFLLAVFVCFLIYLLLFAIVAAVVVTVIVIFVSAVAFGQHFFVVADFYVTVVM